MEPEQGKLSIWTKITVVLVIIASVVSIFTCAILGIYFNPSIPDPGVDVPTAALTVERFENPHEGNTTNSGGWVATVKDLAGPIISLDKLTVYAGGTIPGGAKYFGVEGVSIKTSDVYHQGPEGSWYLHRYYDSPLQFMDGDGLTNLTNSTAGDVDPDESRTIQGTSVIYYDNDNDGNLSVGDSIRVFKDVNADGGRDIVTGHKIVIEHKKKRIGEITLPPP